MAPTVRFDPSAPYEVDEADVVFARPGGAELLARVYRPRGESGAPLAASALPCTAPLVRSFRLQAPPWTSTTAVSGAAASPRGR